MLAAATVFGSAAQAVIVAQGEIETDGVSNTIDLWFFSLAVASDTVIVVSPLSVGPPLTGFENPQLLVYVNDGSLDAADFVAGADDTIGLTPQLTLNNLAAGDYVFVVGASDIGVGQFGPTQTDALSTMGFVYELGISDQGGNEGALTCVLEGQLGGGFARSVLSVDNCVEPTQAAEPATFGLLGLGLVALGTLRTRRRAAAR
jgi:hypothetical protein